MKILIDLTSLNDNFSGIERFALNISKEMLRQDQKNFYILVFKNEVHPDFNEFIEDENVKILIINGSNKLLFNQIKLPYKLYKIKADKYIFLAFPSPILFRRKGIINTIHDLTAFLYPETMNNKSRIYFKYSIINAIRLSEKIITVSESSKIDINKKFKIENIYVIYNGISETFKNFNYDPKINKKVMDKYKLDGEYILSLSTLEPRKNLNILLSAYNNLMKNRRVNYKLVLAGRRGWKFENLIRGIDEKFLKENVKFTGFIEDYELPYIYMNSKAFIFPSIYEGFGIPIIEAAYMEIPLVLSDINSSIEITGGNAVFFKSRNQKSLEETLENLNLLNFKGNIKTHILKYDWEIQAKKFLEII